MTEQCGKNLYDYSQEKICPCGCGMKVSECPGYRHGKEGHCEEKFLTLADEAWKEVLKEKIKAKIIAKKGEHLDKLADIIAKTNGEKWKNKIAAKMRCSEFKDELKDFFSSSCE